MYIFKEISGLTRVAIVALVLYMVVNALAQGGTFYDQLLAAEVPAQGMSGATALLAILNLVVMVVTSIIVCCWIYRASANAHTIDSGLTIRAGWAVGWYFIPFANLWKPFQAMKETWLASHYGVDWGAGDATGLLNWWWGLWLVAGFLSNISWRLTADVPQFGAGLGLAEGIVTIPLSLVLIKLMRQIRDAQKVTRHAEVFA